VDQHSQIYNFANCNFIIFKSNINSNLVTNQKTAVVSIINSIHTDARVQKTCKELFLAGFEVIVIDRKLGSLGFQTTYNFKLISLQAYGQNFCLATIWTLCSQII
jgi:hypothetical protein